MNTQARKLTGLNAEVNVESVVMGWCSSSRQNAQEASEGGARK